MRLWMNVLSFNRPRATFHFGFSDNRTHTCSMQHNGQHCWPGRTTRRTTVCRTAPMTLTTAFGGFR